MWLVIESLKRLSNAYCPKGAIPCFRYVDLALLQLPALHWNGCFPGQTTIAAKGMRHIVNITHSLSPYLSLSPPLFLSLYHECVCVCACAHAPYLYSFGIGKVLAFRMIPFHRSFVCSDGFSPVTLYFLRPYTVSCWQQFE